MKLIKCLMGKSYGKSYITELANKNIETQEYLKDKIKYLENKKRNLLFMGLIGPENGGIISEIDFDIRETEDLIRMLDAKKERNK